MQFTEEHYKNLISKLGLSEMPIKKVELATVPIPKNYDKDFFKVSIQFIKYIANNNITDLMNANISFDEIDIMEKGIIPKNFTVFLKIPVEYGGKLEFSNMFLIKTFPVKEILNTFLRTQIINYNKANDGDLKYPTILYAPNPKGLIFTPQESSFAGFGGNTTTDKMTEIGSTMFLNKNERF